MTEPSLDTLVMEDGAILPVRCWPASPPARGVMLALHGINDHAAFCFSGSAPAFAAAGIHVYAYDQRGFGAGPHPGRWAGTAALTGDASAAARSIGARHPGLRLTLLGESMGAAVLIVAMGGADPPPGSALVLCAPALWPRAEMPRRMRWALRLAALAPPHWRLASRREFVPTDNPAVLRRWADDPLVLRSTSLAGLVGLVDLMEAAVAALPACLARGTPVLTLVGRHDRLMPPGVTRTILARAGAGRFPHAHVGFYERGWHLLLRDLNAPMVVGDVLRWLETHDPKLASGAEVAAAAWLAG